MTARHLGGNILVEPGGDILTFAAAPLAILQLDMTKYCSAYDFLRLLPEASKRSKHGPRPLSGSSRVRERVGQDRRNTPLFNGEEKELLCKRRSTGYQPGPRRGPTGAVTPIAVENAMASRARTKPGPPESPRIEKDMKALIKAIVMYTLLWSEGHSGTSGRSGGGREGREISGREI
jgi:hypothetical protein